MLKEYDKKKIILFALLGLIFLGLLVWLYIRSTSNIRTIDGKNYDQGEVQITNSSNNVARGSGNTNSGVVNKNNTNNGSINNGNTNSKNKKYNKTPRLFKISNKETSGIRFGKKVLGGYDIKYFTSKDGKTFTTRTTLYDNNLKQLKPKEVKDQIYRDIANVIWISDTKKIVVYIDRFGNKITLIDDNNSNKKTNLPNNIESMTVSKDGKIFYMVRKNNSTEGHVYDYKAQKNKKDKIVFTSPLLQWNSSWKGTNRVLVYTKNISNQKGVSYLINTSTGVYTKENIAMYNMQGLLNPLASKIAYFGRYGKKESNKIFIKDTATKKVKEINYSTFAEKCVWSKNNTVLFCSLPKKIASVSKNEPDDWYKGLTTFEDKFVRIDATNGLITELFDPEDYGVRVDAVKLGLSQNDDFLYFTDKNTLRIWGYKINPNAQ